MAIRSFKVEKLIRDFIPEILKSKGIVMHTRVMEPEEFIQRLKDKLLEESEEVRQTKNSDELLEELADVMEIMHTLAAAEGLSMELIEKKRAEKQHLRGGFADRLYNHQVDLDEHNQEIAYYTTRPEQYPSIERELSQ